MKVISQVRRDAAAEVGFSMVLRARSLVGAKSARCETREVRQ